MQSFWNANPDRHDITDALADGKRKPEPVRLSIGHTHRHKNSEPDGVEVPESLSDDLANGITDGDRNSEPVPDSNRDAVAKPDVDVDSNVIHVQPGLAAL